VYTGDSHKLPVGRYLKPANMGIPNDSLISLKIEKGYSITLYEHADFVGAKSSFNEDVPDLGLYGFRKKTSSCIIGIDPEYIESKEDIDENDKSVPIIPEKLSSVGLSNAEFLLISVGLGVVGIIIGIGVYYVTKNFRIPKKMNLIDTNVKLGD
jgi:hypothetical protein